MSVETMTKLATFTVSSTSAGYEFINIPQTYSSLKLVVSGRQDLAQVYGVIGLYFNNNATGLTYRVLSGYNSSATSSEQVNTNGIYGVYSDNGATSTASTFSSLEFNFPNYTSNRYKTVLYDEVSEGNATDQGYLYLGTGLWLNTQPINRIWITTGGSGASFVANTTLTLYGIRNARRTAGNSVKAIGGNISFDGTYVVHTFNSSGTFTPTSPIPDADFLVVAGGGGGGGATNTANNRAGGGGGAGGYKCSVPGETSGAGSSAQSRLSLSPYVNYSITIGAGGARGTSSTNGTNGSDSFFHTVQSFGGGGGGRSSVNGNTGGSGGGGGAGGTGGTASTTGGAGLGGNGYAGGNSGTSFYNAAPGGGGAGAVGGGLLAHQTGGLGGNGLQSRISGTLTYYAGGGGGGGELFRSTGGLGGGGRGALQQNGTLGAGGSQHAEAGTTNTGGGGGGSTHDTSWGGEMLAAAGGSGIVIIRYKG